MTILVCTAANIARSQRRNTRNSFVSFISIIKDAMKSGEKLRIAGFGSFEGKVRPARQAKNPATGETISLPESRVPAFKPAKLLKEELNK